MLKKFVSSLLAVILLAGCGSSSENTATETDNSASCADIASQLVSDLDLGEVVSEAKSRIVYGSFFNSREGDESCPVTEAAAWLPSDKNSDTVGVFKTDDAEATVELLNEYLDAQTALSEMYSPEEVFKISNAIVSTNKAGNMVILVVCSDIEAAKKKVDAVLGN